MRDSADRFTPRAATSSDAAAIAEIYNDGIADRVRPSRPNRARHRKLLNGSGRVCW